VSEAARRSFWELEAESLAGERVDLGRWRGHVALVVNVASQCGYTPQYAGLEALWREHGERGLVVLGFPSNDFGRQEPGDAEAIRAFCASRYEVGFPLMAKCAVGRGPAQSPVYAFLERQSGKLPSWNFGKYLVGRDGRVIAFFESGVAPDDPELVEALEQALSVRPSAA
jgi:glutathione peroxidase